MSEFKQEFEDTGGRKEDTWVPFRPIVTDVETIFLSKQVDKSLDCAVCWSTIDKCTTTMECLHRFCEECIETTLRQGQKKCPVCVTPCPSRRNLRADKNFDLIIRSIITDRSKEEEQRDLLVQQKIKSRDHKAFAENLEKAASQQEQIAKKRRTTSTVPMRAPPPKKSIKPEKILFSMKLHPNCPTHYNLARPYLRTSRSITVGVLLQYLARKFSLPSPDGISLFIWCEERLERLRIEDQTLDYIESNIWAFPSGLTLFYNVQT
eukprot:gb/GEZN01014556.1/.p1 GENE.gb/GEZN01014556.1/~~gb/GEZN01014556.1/.p1  ORF type:complete len:264 (+),score=42.36 gb/GEZN01014556.1/:142-933(+)